MNSGFRLVLEPKKLQNCMASVKIMSPDTLGSGERKGGCGPDVQEELAASVQVVCRVKSEKAVHWEGFSSF